MSSWVHPFSVCAVLMGFASFACNLNFRWIARQRNELSIDNHYDYMYNYSLISSITMSMYELQVSRCWPQLGPRLAAPQGTNAAQAGAKPFHCAHAFASVLLINCWTVSYIRSAQVWSWRCCRQGPWWTWCATRNANVEIMRVINCVKRSQALQNIHSRIREASSQSRGQD